MSNWGDENSTDPLLEETPKNLTNEQKALYLVDLVTEEWQSLRRYKYPQDRAKRTAALSLEAGKAISAFVVDLEAYALGCKAEIGVVTGEVAETIQAASDKKVTDAAMERLINKSVQVVDAKKKQYEAEKNFKQWTFNMNFMKESHILFRGIGNKSE